LKTERLITVYEVVIFDALKIETPRLLNYQKQYYSFIFCYYKGSFMEQFFGPKAPLITLDWAISIESSMQKNP